MPSNPRLPLASITTPAKSSAKPSANLSCATKRTNGPAREAAIGFVQLEAGQTVEIQSKQHFIDLIRSEA